MAQQPRLSERISAHPLFGRTVGTLSSAYERYGKNSPFKVVRDSVAVVETQLQSPLVSTVESYVVNSIDRIGSTIEHSVHTVSTTTASSIAMAHRAAEIAHETRQAVKESVEQKKQTVKHTISSVALQVENKLTTIANTGVNIANNLVERIPAAPEEQPDDEDEAVDTSDVAPAPSSSALGTASRHVLHRLKRVSGKAKARVIAAALTQLHNAQAKGEQTVQTLRTTASDLVGQFPPTTTSLIHTTSEYINQARSTAINVAHQVSPFVLSTSFRHRIYDLSQDLTHNPTVVRIYDVSRSTLDNYLPLLPAPITSIVRQFIPAHVQDETELTDINEAQHSENETEEENEVEENEEGQAEESEEGPAGNEAPEEEHQEETE